MSNRLRFTGYTAICRTRGLATPWVKAAGRCTLDTEHSAALCIKLLRRALSRALVEFENSLEDKERAWSQYAENMDRISAKWPGAFQRANRLHRGYKPRTDEFRKHIRKAMYKRLTPRQRQKWDIWNEVRAMDRADSSRLVNAPLYRSEWADHTGEAQL